MTRTITMTHSTLINRKIRRTHDRTTRTTITRTQISLLLTRLIRTRTRENRTLLRRITGTRISRMIIGGKAGGRLRQRMMSLLNILYIENYLSNAELKDRRLYRSRMTLIIKTILRILTRLGGTNLPMLINRIRLNLGSLIIILRIIPPI